MEKQRNADYLDLIFRGRNKNYGAYVLRRCYPARLLKALLSVLTGSGIICLLVVLSAKEVTGTITGINEQLIDSIRIVKVDLEFTKPSEPATAHKPTPPRSRSTTSPVIIRDSIAEPEQPDSLNATLRGPAGDSSNASLQDTIHFGEGDESRIKPDTSFEMHLLTRLPEYEGGMNGIRKFVARNIHYPPPMAMAGIDGYVVLSFIVDVDGSVTDVKVSRSAGEDFDQEAQRVLSLLPPFKTPGKIGSRPVRTKMALPIKFRIDP